MSMIAIESKREEKDDDFRTGDEILNNRETKGGARKTFQLIKKLNFLF